MISTTMATPATSSSSSKDTSLFDKAKRANKLTFAAYVASLLLAAGLTYLAGRSADRVAELAQAEANRLIAESSTKAARANEGAALANERAGKLEHDNLELRGKIVPLERDAADAKGALAELQIRASDAVAAQQRVEIELGKYQERAAIAERSLLELREKVADRDLLGKRSEFLSALHGLSGITVFIFVVQSDAEAGRFAKQIRTLLNEAGWSVPGYGSVDGPPFIGMELRTAGLTSPNAPITQLVTPEPAARLIVAFKLAGFPITSTRLAPGGDANVVYLYIGTK